MRIALVVPGGVDRSGEIRTIPAVVALVKQLASRHDVAVFALRQEAAPGEWVLHGARVHNVGDPFPQLRSVGRVVRGHRAQSFDVVHAIFGGSVGFAAVAAARWIGAPGIVHVAGGELAALDDIGYGGARRLVSRLRERWTLRRASAVTAASAPILAQIAALGITAQRIPLGVDLAAWPAQPPAARSAAEPARLIHVASLNRVKDQATLLRAMATLAATGVDFRLDVFGEDTLGSAVQSLACELGLASRVTFHGYVTQRRLHPLMTRAHVNLVSSRHEAGPLVVLEAAVVGVPTVGTAVGHLAEWSPDAALAVPVGDAAALAAAVGRLLDDEALRLRLAHEAQRRACEQDAAYTAACFERLYRSASAARTE
jgi:glycosyltransferase involved in cell wall biosynthesis